MARYILLLPEGEDRKDALTPEQKAAGYETHGKFAALLAERGHTITAGAELEHSRYTTTIRKNGAGFEVTDGPYAEGTEQIVGFYSIDTDDLADLVECCKTLGETIELRPVVAPEG